MTGIANKIRNWIGGARQIIGSLFVRIAGKERPLQVRDDGREKPLDINDEN